jgi:hypothetical protein
MRSGEEGSWLGGLQDEAGELDAQGELGARGVAGGELDAIESERERILLHEVEKTGEVGDGPEGIGAALEGRGALEGAFPLGPDAADTDAAFAGPAVEGLEELAFGLGGLGGEGLSAHGGPAFAEGGFAIEEALAIGDALPEGLDFGGPCFPGLAQRGEDEAVAEEKGGESGGDTDEETEAGLWVHEGRGV